MMNSKSVAVFLTGHIDDNSHKEKGRVVIDILNPPWAVWPSGVMSFYPYYERRKNMSYDTSEIEWRQNGERFSFLMKSWNVDRAKEILANTPTRPITLVDITNLRDYVARTKMVDPETGEELPEGAELIPGKMYNVSGGAVLIDWKRIDKQLKGEDVPNPVDMRIPLILATYDFGIFPIDGWQRIALAFELNENILPAVQLTEDETKIVED